MADTGSLRSLLTHLPEALVELRGGLGLSQKRAVELARESGCKLSKSQLSNWENGHRLPMLDSLVCYLASLRLNLCDLHRALEDRAGGPVFEPLDDLLLPGSEPSHLRAGVEEFARRTDLADLSLEISELRAELARIKRSRD